MTRASFRLPPHWPSPHDSGAAERLIERFSRTRPCRGTAGGAARRLPRCCARLVATVRSSADLAAIRESTSVRAVISNWPRHRGASPLQGARRRLAGAGARSHRSCSSPCQAYRRVDHRNRRHWRHLAAGASHRHGSCELAGSRHCVARPWDASAAYRPRRWRPPSARSGEPGAWRWVHGARHGQAGRPRTELFVRCGPRAAVRSGGANIHGCNRRPRAWRVHLADRAWARGADGGARSRRLRVPHRSASAPRPVGHAAGGGDARSHHLLRKHGPELGTCRHDQGATGAPAISALGTGHVPGGDPSVCLAAWPGFRCCRRYPRHEAADRPAQGAVPWPTRLDPVARVRPGQQREAGRGRHSRDPNFSLRRCSSSGAGAIQTFASRPRLARCVSWCGPATCRAVARARARRPNKSCAGSCNAGSLPPTARIHELPQTARATWARFATFMGITRTRRHLRP